MSENIQSDNSPGETMRLAVERFRTRKESANRQFLQDRIDEIEAMHFSSEKEKLYEMRGYWPDFGVQRDPDSWYDDALKDLGCSISPRDGKRLAAREREDLVSRVYGWDRSADVGDRLMAPNVS